MQRDQEPSKQKRGIGSRALTLGLRVDRLCVAVKGDSRRRAKVASVAFVPLLLPSSGHSPWYRCLLHGMTDLSVGSGKTRLQVASSACHLDRSMRHAMNA